MQFSQKLNACRLEFACASRGAQSLPFIRKTTIGAPVGQGVGRRPAITGGRSGSEHRGDPFEDGADHFGRALDILGAQAIQQLAM